MSDHPGTLAPWTNLSKPSRPATVRDRATGVPGQDFQRWIGNPTAYWAAVAFTSRRLVKAFMALVIAPASRGAAALGIILRLVD